jgi:hypothetical protein
MTHKKILNKILLKLAISIGVTGMFFSSTGAEDFVNIIKRVKFYEIPLIKNDSIIYKMDIEFKKPPLHFWSYSDSTHHAHIIEIYGVAVESPPIRLPDNSPFQSLRIKNQKTKMALSGLMSTIIISIDPDYSCGTEIGEQNEITVTLWKKMNAMKGKKIKSNLKIKSN